MKLSEFIKQKREELGLKYSSFEDEGICANTYQNIMKDKQKSLRPATMDKLARVLKCSRGDIQACLAETDDQLRNEAEKPEGIAGIRITATKKKDKYDEIAKIMREKPYVTAPDEEPAEVFKSEVEVCETHMQTAEEFKQELRDLFVKLASCIRLSDEPINTLTSSFGKAVLDMIAEKGETNE